MKLPSSLLLASLVSAVAAFLLGTLALNGAPAPGANSGPQGGGVAFPAWHAEYFPNPTLAGDPAYVKNEVRVAFDWEDWRPILGVRAENVRAFPRENISARFTGRLVARFAEEYTFKLTSDEGARLRVRLTGEPDAAWKTLIDAWQPHARRVDTAKLRLDPAKSYDVVLEYYNLKGDAVCSLSWSSPSTPEEVVDYVSGNTVREYWPHMLANLYEMGGNDLKTPLDELGWPTTDFKFTLLTGYTFYPGRHLLVFKGSAAVELNDSTFVVGDESFPGKLPKGKGYNPATNETRALVDIRGTKDGVARCVIAMSQTQRSPESPVGSGVTGIALMQPTRVNGTQPHQPGEVINGEAREAFLPTYTFRVQRTGLNDVEKWSDRTRPAFARIIAQHSRAELCYEKLVLAANELGRDLYLCYGGSIDEEFMTNLAKLVRFGSDGENVYDKPTPNPVYPPLNPNLRLYLEHGNEMGWSAIQPRQWSRDFAAIRKEKREPVWSVVNFDGAAEKNEITGLFRYHAYRTVLMSDVMRKVWGDAAINDRVRVMIFGQYERDFQNTVVQFIDDYYNNGAGDFVKNPRPPAKILYASGPAVYYGTVNMWAVPPEGTPDILRDGGFESYEVPAGQSVLAPKGGAWTFSGGAGVVDDRLPRHLAFTVPGGASDPRSPAAPASTEKKVKTAAGGADASLAVGFQFTVGAKDLYVYEVGRVAQPGEKGAREVLIYQASGEKVASMRTPSLKLDKLAPGQIAYSPLEYDAWITSDSSRVGLWRLEAGKSYVVVSTEAAGAKLPDPAPLAAGPGLTIDGAVRVALGGEPAGGKGSIPRPELVSGPGTGFPLATFRYTDDALTPAKGMVVVPADPKVDPTWAEGGKGKSFVPPAHRVGTRAAFIAGLGKLSQKFTITKPGDYAFVFSASCGHTGDNPVTITVDGKEVWTRTLPAAGRKPKHGVFQWGTKYFPLTAGEHELVIETTKDNPASVVYFYATHLGSMMDYAGGENAANFLGAGAATGQTTSGFFRNARVCTLMAQNWGLVPMAYEGGTQPGGDWNGGGVLYTEQFKWDHPVARVADNQWARLWHAYGGRNAMYYYEGFPSGDIQGAENYQPWKAAIERASRWELEPREGIAVPGKLTPELDHSQGSIASTHAGWSHPLNMKEKSPRLTKGQWKAWLVLVPEAREYDIALTGTAGGVARLSADDHLAPVVGASDSGVRTRVFLAKGIHAIKVRCNEGAFDITAINVK